MFGQNITVDFGTNIKTGINNGVASANLCWLLDSDLPPPNSTQSMRTALAELGVKSLRFPYGALAENYLWDTAPFDSTKPTGNLNPKVASSSEAPGTWSWAVNKNGTFKNAMDFDEYMNLCNSLGIEPLVVVNIQSSKFNKGPTAQDLINSAVEWVKYAKAKNYDVAYWQIGNEVEHRGTVFTKEEYIAHYVKMVTAMKAVDSTIKIGPGLIGKTDYFKDIINSRPDLIDFVSTHQYMHKFKDTDYDYNTWKNSTSMYIPNIVKMQKAVAKSSKPTMELLITETGVSAGNKPIGTINNTYKALWWFDVLMSEISQKNVAYSYFWGTHSPWNGNEDVEEKDVAILLRVDDNSRKPTAEIVKLVNENITANLVEVTSPKTLKYIKIVAGISNDGKNHSIFLLNRNDEAKEVLLQLHNLNDSVQHFTRKEFKGNSPEDIKPVIKKSENVTVLNHQIQIKVPPLSVTILTSINTP